MDLETNSYSKIVAALPPASLLTPNRTFTTEIVQNNSTDDQRVQKCGILGARTEVNAIQGQTIAN